MSRMPLERFLQLLEESRLVDDRRLQKTRARRETNPEAIAGTLVKRGHLTRWQARMLLAGRSGPFFLGNYRLVKLLGRGGMGAVYKAAQAAIGRTVALKVVSRETLKDERSLARFQREIRAAAALDHPHIVHAFDAGCESDTYYLVMEYVGGRDLKHWIQSAGRLSVGWVCECVRQAALGLQYAHERGIVHRDIKPSNLLLVKKSVGEPPHVKIADFGLARAGLDIVETGGLTRIGQGLGTSEYVAPEQASDSTKADVRSDIFSLGCTLFELLTGQLPFNGSSSFERLMARFKQSAPPVGSLRTDVPPELDRIVARMMERDPDRRFQTPAEVAAALAPYCQANQAAADSVEHAPTGSLEKPAGGIAAGADPALRAFLESLSGEFSSRSFPSLPALERQNLRRSGLSLAIAALAVLFLFVVSWTLSGGK